MKTDHPFAPGPDFNMKRALLNSSQPFPLIGADVEVRQNQAKRAIIDRVAAQAVLDRKLAHR